MENYQISNNDPQAALIFWRGVLEDEGSEPNEGTIETVMQLEKQVADLKQAARHKKHKKQPTVKTVAIKQEPKTYTLPLPDVDADTVVCGIVLAIGIYILTRRPDATPRYSSHHLRAVGNIELGPVANADDRGKRT